MSRAKPLNEATMAALRVAVATLNDEIEYVDHGLAMGNDADDGRRHWRAGKLDADTAARWKVKRAALVRARDWIVAKLESKTEDET